MISAILSRDLRRILGKKHNQCSIRWMTKQNWILQYHIPRHSLALDLSVSLGRGVESSQFGAVIRRDCREKRALLTSPSSSQLVPAPPSPKHLISDTYSCSLSASSHESSGCSPGCAHFSTSPPGNTNYHIHCVPIRIIIYVLSHFMNPSLVNKSPLNLQRLLPAVTVYEARCQL